MGDDLRALIRSAQQAEIAGRKGEAAQHLLRAARACFSCAQGSRAASLCRQGLRLDPGNEELEELLALARKAEGGSRPEAEGPGRVPTYELDPASAIGPPLPMVQVEDEGPGCAPRPLPASSPEQRVAATRGRVRVLPDLPRGPVLHDEAEEAWCSFCCSPGSKVGPLVAGPAGAYACRSCLEASLDLLGARPSKRKAAAGKAAEGRAKRRRVAAKPRRR